MSLLALRQLAESRRGAGLRNECPANANVLQRDAMDGLSSEHGRQGKPTGGSWVEACEFGGGGGGGGGGVLVIGPVFAGGSDPMGVLTGAGRRC